MERSSTIADLEEQLRPVRASGRTVGLVPTMGALHDGHLQLVRRLADEVDVVVVSVFVNPTQFERPDDLASYPRDLERDVERLRSLGRRSPQVLFVPSVDEVYPREPVVSVTVRGGLTQHLCGGSRPGHFDAVATVVTKLLNMVRPDAAAFGRKDRQQLEVIRRLVLDLNLRVRVVDVPTVREPGGLALSSRNRRLPPQLRHEAGVIPRALQAAVQAADVQRAAGRPVAASVVRDAAAAILHRAPGLVVDYLEVVDALTLAPGVHEEVQAPLLVAVAAYLGDVRLIDNVELGHLEDERSLQAALVRSDPSGTGDR